MDKTIISRLLLALLVLSRSSAVLNGVVKQAAAVFDPWNIPVVYVQPILLGPSTLRVNVAVYNLTNAFWPTDEEWMPGGPLGAYSAGPVARYNYSLGNLYAFDISIRWNASVLSYVSHGRTVPRGTTPQSFRSKGILNSPVILAVDDVNPVAGSCRVSCSSQYPAASFNAPLDAANVFFVTFAVLSAGDYGLSLDSVDLAVDSIRFPEAQPVVPWRVVLDPDLTTNVGVDAAPRNKDVVGEGKLFDTYALVKNTGTTPKTFSITIYAGATQIGTASTTVAASTQQTVKISCSTSGLAKGTYPIRAVAANVTGETYTADNEVVQGSIMVTLTGDVDGSASVNIFDIVKCAASYGACLPDPWYCPYCDIDNDGCSDIFDIVRVVAFYGRSW